MARLARIPGTRSAAAWRRTAAAAAALLCVAVVAPSASAASDPSPRASTTSNGATLTATPTVGLDPAGATIRVRGRGYDPTVGIYIALCVKPAKGQVPSPCGGGVNTAGTSPASAWISSNPPPYGATLATPYGRRGSFSVRLQVSSVIGDVDCRAVACAIVTRADHTHQGDRRFDLVIPVTFRP